LVLISSSNPVNPAEIYNLIVTEEEGNNMVNNDQDENQDESINEELKYNMARSITNVSQVYKEFSKVCVTPISYRN
jgi:hypothetical protein